MNLLFQEDMAEIEAMHATIRRNLYMLSLQTNSCDIMELSDKHVLHQVRNNPTSYGVKAPANVGIDGFFQAPATTDEATEPDAKRTKVRRGPFREYLSELADA